MDITIVQQPHAGVHNSTGHMLGVNNPRTYIKERSTRYSSQITHMGHGAKSRLNTTLI